MNGLPPLADADDIEIIFKACLRQQALVRKHPTENCLRNWDVSFSRLQMSIFEHIKSKRKVYRKFDNDGRLLERKMQANITLYEGLNVYVEMEIKNNRLVIIAAHDHYTRELPQ